MGGRITKLIHKEKEIIYIDLSNFNLRTKDELIDNINKAKEFIAKNPLKSVYAITDVSNTSFDKELTNLFKEYSAYNSPYIKASAVIGISGLQKILLSAVKAITGRSFFLADSLDEAKEWIVRQ